MAAGRRASGRRRVAIVAAAIVATTLGALVLGAVFLRSATFHRWLRDQVVERLAARLAARVTLGALTGDLGGGLVLRDLTIAADGERILAIRRAEVRYDLLALVTRRQVRLTSVAIEGLALRLVEDARGWNVARLGRRAPPDDVSLLTSVGIDELHVADAVVKIVRPGGIWRTRDLALAASADLGSARQHAHVATLSATVADRGLRIEELAADVTRGADGALSVEGLQLKTAASALRGRLALAAGARVYDVFLEASPLAAAELRSVTGRAVPARDVTGTLRAAGPAAAVAVAADLHSASGALDLAGHVDVTRTPFAYDLAASLAHVDLASILGAAVPASDLSGRVTVVGTGTSLETAAVKTTVALRDSRVATASLATVTAGAEIAARTVSFEATLETPDGGRAAARGTVALADERYDLTLRTAGLDPRVLTGRPELDGRWSGTATLVGSGFAPATAVGEARIVLEPSRVAAMRVRGGRAELRARAGRLTIEQASLDSDVLTARASGWLALASPPAPASPAPLGTLRYELRAADLRPLARLAGTAPLGGALQVSGTAGGSLDALQARARFDAHELVRDGVTIARLRGDIEASRPGSDRARVVLRAHAEELGIAGRRFAALDLDGTWDRERAGRARMMVALDVREDPTHHHALAATADLGAGESRIALDSVRVAAGDRIWRAESRPLIVRRGDRVTIADFTLRAGSDVLRIEGSAGTSGAQDLSLTLDALDLELLGSMAGEALSGRARVTAHLRGTAAAPTLDAEVAVAAPSVGALRYESARATLAIVAGEARGRVLLTQQAGRELVLEGVVPVAWSLAPPRFAVRDGLSGRLHAVAIDLALLDPLIPAVTRLAGTLDADVTLGGSLARPTGEGTLTIDHGRAYVVPLGVTYEPIDARLRIAGTSIEIVTLRITSGPGALTAGGVVTLAETTTALDARLELARFPLFANANGHGAASGTITLGGTAAAPVVEGRLTTAGLVLQLPESLPGGMRPPDPTIVVIGPAAPPPIDVTATPEHEGGFASRAPALYRRAAITIQLDVPRDAWIRRTDTNIELRGWMTAWKKPFEAMHLAGEIEAERGWYSFRGKRFTLAEGRVTFTGEGFDPLLDVVAVHKAGEYTVRANVGGTLTKPALRLESEPALEQADVLAVLLFGRPVNQLSRAESTGLREQAIGVVGDYVAAELGASVAGMLGVDDLQFSSGEGGVDEASVSIGKYVAEDVFVSIAHRFGAQNAGEIRIDYRITPQWSLETSSDTLGDTGIDLFWKRRY